MEKSQNNNKFSLFLLLAEAVKSPVISLSRKSCIETDIILEAFIISHKMSIKTKILNNIYDRGLVEFNDVERSGLYFTHYVELCKCKYISDNVYFQIPVIQK